MKTCSKCKKERPLNEFGTRKSRSAKPELHGVRYVKSHCMSCSRIVALACYHANGKDRPIHRRHHLTDEQYQDLWDKRQGLCHNRTCGNTATQIDHDHSCCPGKSSCGACVTGLLCGGCNTAEGSLGSDAARAHGLMQYIKQTRGVRQYALGA